MSTLEILNSAFVNTPRPLHNDLAHRLLGYLSGLVTPEQMQEAVDCCVSGVKVTAAATQERLEAQRVQSGT